jgi:hypothetical protein
LRLDRLPMEARDRIVALRAAGRAWAEIEELSEGFAGKRLPATTLARWYDLRVEQRQKEREAQAERAHAIAGAFLGQGFKDLPESVKNALGTHVFAMMESADEKNDAKFRAELVELGWLLQEYRKSDLKQQALAIEKQKLETVAAKVRGLRQAVAGKKKLEPAELQKRLDEIYGIAN